MLGGGDHVRRRSIRSAIEASPCVRFGKRKHDLVQEKQQIDEGYSESPKKPRIVTKASTTSSKFGGERMIKAQRGILQRQSLEATCLSAEGEDLSISCKCFSPSFMID